MASHLHVKKGDSVTVISGHESIKGKSGKVLRVFPKKGTVIVEGLRMIKKHQRATQTSQGGIVQREGAIPASKVKLSGSSAGEQKVASKAKKK